MVDARIQQQTKHIPPMLLQPLIENAIERLRCIQHKRRLILTIDKTITGYEIKVYDNARISKSEVLPEHIAQNEGNGSLGNLNSRVKLYNDLTPGSLGLSCHRGSKKLSKHNGTELLLIINTVTSIKNLHPSWEVLS